MLSITSASMLVEWSSVMDNVIPSTVTSTIVIYKDLVNNKSTISSSSRIASCGSATYPKRTSTVYSVTSLPTMPSLLLSIVFMVNGLYGYLPSPPFLLFLVSASIHRQMSSFVNGVLYLSLHQYLFLYVLLQYISYSSLQVIGIISKQCFCFIPQIIKNILTGTTIFFTVLKKCISPDIDHFHYSVNYICINIG